MDSLRDRIVTALWESWQPTEPSIESMADAVIEALGLKRQDNDLDTAGPYRHRYVTDWSATDE